MRITSCRRILAETPPEEIRPPKLLTGDDLREMGYKPGPVFSQILGDSGGCAARGQSVETKDEAERLRPEQVQAERPASESLKSRESLPIAEARVSGAWATH